MYLYSKRKALTSYANDCVIMTPGQDIDDICSMVKCYLANLSHYFIATQLKIPPTNFSATLITIWTKEYRLELDVNFDDVKIP